MQLSEDKTGTRAVGAGEALHGRSCSPAPPPKRATERDERAAAASQERGGEGLSNSDNSDNSDKGVTHGRVPKDGVRHCAMA